MTNSDQGHNESQRDVPDMRCRDENTHLKCSAEMKE